MGIKQSLTSKGLSIFHARAVGIDVGSRFHVMAVSSELAAEPVQTFEAFAGDLNRMAQRLKATGVETVVMESTGVYWVAVYEILEVHGLNVVLAITGEVKSVLGRKSDVNYAQWLQRLHACGLLRENFRPEKNVKALRVYLRHQERLSDYRAANIQHMQKGVGLNEYPVTSCREQFDGCHWNEDRECDLCREARPQSLGYIQRCEM
ncbi:transposase [Coleofasciculus sp. LEGE 07081]|nr:transposase [Coleofasciculus sp. LEGE 07081]